MHLLHVLADKIAETGAGSLFGSVPQSCQMISHLLGRNGSFKCARGHCSFYNLAEEGALLPSYPAGSASVTPQSGCYRRSLPNSSILSILLGMMSGGHQQQRFVILRASRLPTILEVPRELKDLAAHIYCPECLAHEAWQIEGHLGKYHQDSDTDQDAQHKG